MLIDLLTCFEVDSAGS